MPETGATEKRSRKRKSDHVPQRGPIQVGMDVYVSMDMEGVAGVVSREHLHPVGESDHYRRACHLMTEEANAAVRGAFEAGATRVVVNDGHGSMINLDPEQLDSRAECSIGYPKPYGMMAGLTKQFSAAVFIGYHGGAGLAPAVLDHTVSFRVFRAVKLNGRRQTDATLNAALAGHHSVTVALVTGDEATCAEARDLLGAHLPTVATKAAFGAQAAYNIHPSVSHRRIEAAVKEGLARIKGEQLKPLVIDPPYRLEVDVASTLVADYAATMPGVSRPAGRTLRFEEATDYLVVYRALTAMAMLGSLAGPQLS